MIRANRPPARLQLEAPVFGRHCHWVGSLVASLPASRNARRSAAVSLPLLGDPFEVQPLNLTDAAATVGRERLAVGLGRLGFGEQLPDPRRSPFPHVSFNVIRPEAEDAQIAAVGSFGYTVACSSSTVRKRS